MTNWRTTVAVALYERGIETWAEFAEVFGVPHDSITLSTALVFATAPAWVFETWLPNAGCSSPVAFIPMAVRAVGEAIGVEQYDDESPHDFNDRLRAAYILLKGL